MKKILIAYFSHGGENLIENTIQDIGPVGNTAKAAQILQGNLVAMGLEADLFEIEAKEPYPFSYMDTANRARQEKMMGTKPAIKEGPEGFEGYDLVFLGYPNWWGTCPQAVLSFTSTHDFRGKVLVPFVTHGGQIFLYSIDDIRATLTGGDIINGFAISASYMNGAEAVIKDWIENNSEILL